MNASGLSLGTYIVTVTDANNCSSTCTVPVQEIAPAETLSDHIMDLSSAVNKKEEESMQLSLTKKQSAIKLNFPEEGFSLGTHLLPRLTKTAFEELRKKIIEAHKLNKEDLPSYYCVAKVRPKTTSGVLTISNEH